MPQILRVRYLGDSPATIPLAGRQIDPDCVFDLSAVVTAEHDDCVIVAHGNPPQDVALPRSLFQVETPAMKKKTEKE